MSATIKDIPSTENILFSSIIGLHEKTFIGVSNVTSVKFAITNDYIYIKVAGVLIDLTGTLKMEISQVTKILVETPLIKANRFMTLFYKNGEKAKFTVKAEECSQIVQILTSCNPDIHVV